MKRLLEVATLHKTLYLMRHGETLFNQLGKIQGQCDSPLTANGIKQAEQAAKFFDDIQLDHVYSSPLERCCDTTELILSGRMAYTRVKGLKEMYFGVYEAESKALLPASPLDYHTFFVPYGGESTDEVSQRMLTTLTEIMREPTDQTVLAVSHGDAIFNFLRNLMDPLAEWEIGFTNCIIFKLEFTDDGFNLIDIIR